MNNVVSISYSCNQNFRLFFFFLFLATLEKDFYLTVYLFVFYLDWVTGRRLASEYGELHYRDVLASRIFALFAKSHSQMKEFFIGSIANI